MGYYRTGKDLPGFLHSPDTCIPASGWHVIEKKKIKMKPAGEESRVLKYVSRSGSAQQVLITWIQSGRRAETDHREMIWNNFVEAATQLRLDDATKIMISTSIAAGESVEFATRRLLDFIDIFYPSFTNLIS
jgi:EpsI family protein